MNIILNFMDKIYGDTKTLSLVYVAGAVLLFIFIILLIFSLRKPSKKDDIKIIDEPKPDNKDSNEVSLNNNVKDTKVVSEDTNTKVEDTKEDIKEEVKDNDSETNIFEKTTIIPLENIKTNESEVSKQESIEKALDNVDNIENIKPEEFEEKKVDEKVSAEIPNVDEFVDNVVKKTYEKNEQFSSVYVGDNTSTMKLDKIMDNVNLDKDVKEEITGVKNEETEEKLPILKDKINEMKEENELGIENNSASDLVSEDTSSKLDNLKEALEAKKQEEVKTETTAINKEDLLNKLNSLKK